MIYACPPLFFPGPSREAEKERLYDTLAFGREAAAAKAVRRLAALDAMSTLSLFCPMRMATPGLTFSCLFSQAIKARGTPRPRPSASQMTGSSAAGLSPEREFAETMKEIEERREYLEEMKRLKQATPALIAEVNRDISLVSGRSGMEVVVL